MTLKVDSLIILCWVAPLGNHRGETILGRQYMRVLLQEGNTLKGPLGVAFNITSAARLSFRNMRFPTVLLGMNK